MWHVWEGRKIHIGWRNQMERDNLEDFDVYGKIVFK
jgi:hypothetical protein